MAGVENKPTVFLFNDVQVVEEAFLEDINNILSSGEVPNLYKPDEFEEVRLSLVLLLDISVLLYDISILLQHFSILLQHFSILLQHFSILR